MYEFVNVIHVHLYSLVYSSARKLGSVSWPNICLALCHVMLPVIVLPVTAYNLISNFFQRQLDGRNSKRSRLRRWIKSVKILTDALISVSELKFFGVIGNSNYSQIPNPIPIPFIKNE